MILAVFRSKTETLNFASILRSYNVPCSVVNTPRNINVSCGISVKFNASYRQTASLVISRRNFSTFGGFYNIWLKLFFQKGGVNGVSTCLKLTLPFYMW